MTTVLYIDKDPGLGKELQEVYLKGEPFPHIVIDNFVDKDFLDKLYDNFPDPQTLEWVRYDNPLEKKLMYSTSESLHKNFKRIFERFNDKKFLKFLEDLTGIKSIEADHNLTGGGLHQIERGGKLDIHADFNILYGTNKRRRLNIILFLNKDWKDEYGGHLELWDEDMAKCEQRILPVYNRAVIFNTDEKSFHGHPDPLQCPEGWTRKSLALYYYTESDGDEQSHSTRYKKRPQDPHDNTLDKFRKFRSLPKHKRDKRDKRKIK